MSLPSLHFFIFAIVVFGANALQLDRLSARKNMLLAASYYFYMCWDWRFSALLLAVACINYFAALRIEGSRSDAARKRWLAFALVGCLGLLAYFKYANFFIESVATLLSRMGWHPELPLLNVLLPVGISFFSFQGISYTIDVYRRQQDATRDFRDFALYIAFFPTVLSGPITRGRQMLPQFTSPLPYTEERGLEGLYLIFRGLTKKLVFADTLALQIVNPAFSQSQDYSTSFLVIAVYAYSLQIYMDLSGYTDMARGVAKTLGFELPENFNRPYQATSVSNFWQRWHISMSGFFRDYLFFALGGSKYGNTYVNLLITFAAIGIWHGGAWNFIVYGLLHGLVVGLERLLRDRYKSWGLIYFVDNTIFPYFAAFLSLNFVAFSRVLFRSDDLDSALDFLAAMLTDQGETHLVPVLGLAALVISIALHYTPRDWDLKILARFRRSPAIVHSGVISGVALLLIAFSSGSATFVYFQF